MADRLKDIFFTHASLTTLAHAIQLVHPTFDTTAFLALIFTDDWEARELKDRLHHVARCLGQTLPPAYSDALAILHQVAPQIQGFDAMVFPDYVEMYGQADWELSMPALAYFTQFGSSEFAVRPFLAQNPGRGMAYMRQWATDANPHVRRLASEGCRPRLPWAMALPQFKADPSPILPVLETLKDDESDYVRRSVANNLNDISKDHPARVLDIAERWYGRSDRTDWIVKHACRGLLKAGNRRAMQLFGFEAPGEVQVRGLSLAKTQLKMGDAIDFGFELHVVGETDRLVRLEYAIDYIKAKGGQSRKVFQHSERRYPPGVFALRKRHSTLDRTTRKHYLGLHQLSIIVNGVVQASATFELALA